MPVYHPRSARPSSGTSSVYKYQIMNHPPRPDLSPRDAASVHDPAESVVVFCLYVCLSVALWLCCSASLPLSLLSPVGALSAESLPLCTSVLLLLVPLSLFLSSPGLSLQSRQPIQWRSRQATTSGEEGCHRSRLASTASPIALSSILPRWKHRR